MERRHTMDLSNPRVDSQLKEKILFQDDELHYGIYIPESEPQFYGDILWHWHDEFEFGVVTKGSIIYKTNQHEYVLNEGDAVFINSGVLHYLQLLVLPSDAGIYTQFFDRTFLAGSSESIFDIKYIKPVVEQTAVDMIPFYQNSSKDRRLIRQIAEAAQTAREKKPFYELHLRNLFSALWEEIYTCTAGADTQVPTENPRDIERIKMMITFMGEHYNDKLTVSQIADCVPVSERECYRLFQNCLNITPTDFLISLRLRKAQDLLASTQKSIVEIALECGFCSSSYFGKVFREEYQIPPGEYRKRNSK